ncbi:hypothetical protein [Streptantibioticus cattleyicolor]|uniref:Uncharacterized protein n=1 Tax=Streptantibioticus cattleyicolor (strain ATCC 35852 / DSM 46488 / JCM 4925 / NBRC 14057 / NRRL 8057) TaxID=1003195 RepID=F8JKT8_STREN|nr:hypothetical protein [Streptantibioticus cattleyicolor]AEW99707.1 hypothetical protein SCATT_p15140 [Streptantibioticus cattleyicolor NRRL 8057 = DSM 46488]CCB71255.1 protein of unknown function [Streptantibioticus cattleyicolor NRRL 8057 = DSM 46488]
MNDPSLLRADSAMTCAFEGDARGIRALLIDLDLEEARKVSIRLAARAAEAMHVTGACAGLTQDQITAVWDMIRTNGFGPDQG